MYGDEVPILLGAAGESADIIKKVKPEWLGTPRSYCDGGTIAFVENQPELRKNIASQVRLKEV